MVNGSSKIDAIIDIVKHHQKAPGQPPLSVKQEPATNDPGRLNTFVPTAWDSLSPGGLTNPDAPRTPDKIVLFVIFPEHNPFLKAVSQISFINIHLKLTKYFLIVFKVMGY